MNKTIKIAILTAAALATIPAAAWGSYSRGGFSLGNESIYGIVVNADSKTDAQIIARERCEEAVRAAHSDNPDTTTTLLRRDLRNCLGFHPFQNQCVGIALLSGSSISQFNLDDNRADAQSGAVLLCDRCETIDLSEEEVCDHTCVLANNEFIVDEPFDNAGCRPARNNSECEMVDAAKPIFDGSNCRARRNSDCAANERVVNNSCERIVCKTNETIESRRCVCGGEFETVGNSCERKCGNNSQRINGTCTCNADYIGDNGRNCVFDESTCGNNEIVIFNDRCVCADGHNDFAEDGTCVPTAEAASENGDVVAHARFYDSRVEAANAALSACANAGGVNCMTVDIFFHTSTGSVDIFNFADCGVAFGVNLITSGIVVGADIVGGFGDDLVSARREAIANCNDATTEQACAEGFANSFEFCHSDINTGGEVLVAVTPNISTTPTPTVSPPTVTPPTVTVTTDECDGPVLIADGSGGCALNPLVCPAPHRVEGFRCVEDTDTGQISIVMITATVTVTVTVPVLTDVVEYEGELYPVTRVAGTNEAFAVVASGVHLRIVESEPTTSVSGGSGGGGGSAAGIIGGVVVVALALWYFASDSDDLEWTPSYAFRNNNGNMSYSVGSRWTATANDWNLYWQTRQNGDKFVYGSGMRYNNGLLSAAMNSESEGDKTDLDLDLSATKTIGLWNLGGGYRFDMELSDTDTETKTETQNRLNAKVRYNVDRWILSATANTDGNKTRAAVNYSYRF